MSYVVTLGNTTANYGGTTLAGSTTAKGAWTQIAASTPVDAHEIIVDLMPSYVGGTDTAVVDIAVGASGAEQIIIPNMLYSQDQWNGFATGKLRFPMQIPAGSRISGRCQIKNAYVPQATVTLINNGAKNNAGQTIVTDYGTSTTYGTALTPTTGAKSAWVQLAATTSYDLSGFYLVLGNGGSSVTTTLWAAIDVGIGAAGSEQVVLPDYMAGVDSNAEIYLPVYSDFIGMNIPAGSRIAVRAQASAAKAVHVQLLGVSR